MFDFQQKNRIRKVLYSKPVVAILVLVALYSLYSTWSIYRKMAQSKQDVENAEREELALAAKNSDLDSQIGELQTQQGVEKEIRSKFGVAKPGENMAVIVPDSESSSTATSTQQSFFQKFLHFFGM